MKKWNTPSVEELDVKETANGYFAADIETLIFFNDSKSTTPNDPENTDPLS